MVCHLALTAELFLLAAKDNRINQYEPILNKLIAE